MVNENEESNAFYDIMLTDVDTQSRTFIEVKATDFEIKTRLRCHRGGDFAVKPGRGRLSNLASVWHGRWRGRTNCRDQQSRAIVARKEDWASVDYLDILVNSSMCDY